MFKELLPQNEELGTLLDTLLISLGWLTSIAGGIAGLVTFRWKTKYQAMIQTEMQAKADELSQTLNEKITRRSKANDLLINRQYAFYDGIPEKINTIFTHMQNIVSVFEWTQEDEDEEDEDSVPFLKKLDDYKKYREKLMFAMTEYHGFVINYAYYVDSSIHKLASDLIKLFNEYDEIYDKRSEDCLRETITMDEFKEEMNGLRKKAISTYNTLIEMIYKKVKEDSLIKT